MQKTRSLSKTTVMKLSIGIICVIGIIAFFGFSHTSTGSKVPKPVIRPVKAMQLMQSTISETRSFPGLVKAVRETKLAFRVGGPLVALDAHIGQYVTKGSILARIDPRDFKVNVMRLEAILSQAHANLDALKKGARSEDVARLKAQLTSAQAQLTTAENDFIRQKNLLADKAASKARYDNAQKAYQMAKANLEAMSQELKKAQRGGRIEELTAAEAGIKKLRADLAAARNALEDTELKAPYDGYVSKLFVENYENVKSGAPVISFIDVSKVEVHTAVPEDIIIRKSSISQIHCTLTAYPGERFDAEIKEVGRKTDSANQSYPFSVFLDVPEGHAVTPGMVATLTLSLKSPEDKRQGFLVPSQAIYAGPEGKSFIWRIDTKTMMVEKTPVTIGALKNDSIQILAGLDAGNLIVTAGAKFLRDNQKIRILNQSYERENL